MKKYLEALAGAGLIALHLLSGPLLHRWRTRWGARPHEIDAVLPGDELVPAPRWIYNHAVTIRAPRSAVWPWLVQLGQGRGGFYSYELLENAIGCDIHNVFEIRPDLQHLKVGDQIRMHASGVGPIVMHLDRERALVLGGEPMADGSASSWAMYLLDEPGGGSRLLERGRGVAGRGFAARLAFGPYLVDPIGFVMSRKMLRTIRDLAEESFSTPTR